MTIVTIGGVTIGLAILVGALITWWPGLHALRKDPLKHLAAIAPFLAAWSYGVLSLLGVGGLVGWAANTSLWISNWLGDVALVWGVGGEPGRTAGTTSYLPLTQTGGAIVLLMTVAMIVGVKKSKRHGGALKAGVWCGICLGTSAGVAGFAAAPLAIAANWAGAEVYGVFV